MTTWMVLLLVINAWTFLLMLMDKKAAIKRSIRIPEVVLLLFAVLGGSAGAMIGMFLFRHKTRHLKFRIGLPVLFFLHLGILLLIFA